MKTQIRTYLEPKLADRLTILSQTSGLSLSALTAELIAKGLDAPLDQPPIKREDAQLSLNDANGLKEMLYLQYLTLQLLLQTIPVEKVLFSQLKTQAQHWAENRLHQILTQQPNTTNQAGEEH